MIHNNSYYLTDIFKYTTDTNSSNYTYTYMYPSYIGKTLTQDDLNKLQHIIDTAPDQKDLVKLPAYPHSDCWINEKSELVLQFAMAGYSKENVSVEVSKTNQLFIKAKGLEVTKDRAYLHSKISRKDINVSLRFDENYSVEESTVKFNDGMLEIVIPRSGAASIKKLM